MSCMSWRSRGASGEGWPEGACCAWSPKDPGNACSMEGLLRRRPVVAPLGLKGCVGDLASEDAAEAPDVGSRCPFEFPPLITALGPALYACANIGFGGYRELEALICAAGAERKNVSKSGGGVEGGAGAVRKNASKSGGCCGVSVEARGGGAVPMYCRARWGPASLVTSPGMSGLMGGPGAAREGSVTPPKMSRWRSLRGR